jgi:hypothetical protein
MQVSSAERLSLFYIQVLMKRVLEKKTTEKKDSFMLPRGSIPSLASPRAIRAVALTMSIYMALVSGTNRMAWGSMQV